MLISKGENDMAFLPAQDDCPEIEFDERRFIDDSYYFLIADFIETFSIDVFTLTDLKAIVEIIEKDIKNS